MGINPKNFMDEPENFMDEQQQAPASIDFGTNPRKLPEASSGVKTYSALDESTKGLLPGLAIGGLAFGGMDALQNIGGGLVRDTAEGLTEGIVNAIFDTLLGGDS